MSVPYSDPDDFARGVEQQKNVFRIHKQAAREIAAEERGPILPPEMLTLREHLARPRITTSWRIAGWQAIGHRVMFAAQYKAGKTTTVSNLIRSLLDGSRFLDEYEVSQLDGTVALLDFEMADNQLVEWYEAQGIKADDRLLVVPMRGRASSFDIVDPIVRSQWATMLRDRGVKYLVVDCLRPILDALGLNEHTDAGIFLVALDALLAEAGIPEAVVVHHMGHSNERSRGDSRLRDWPDVEWTLVRQSEDPASPRFIKAYGRGVEIPETKLVWNPATRRIAVGGGSRRDVNVTAAVQAIAAYVGRVNRQEEPITPTGRQIEKALMEDGLKQKDIRRAMTEAERSRRIVGIKGAGNNGGTAYRLVEEGSSM
jgi:RecA-family ATPase